MNKANIIVKDTARILLGSFLVAAGIGHLTFQRKAFRAQVPDFVPLKKDTTVLISGGVEIALGAALVIGGKNKKTVGRIAAAFFTAAFPGNIAQYVHGRDAFGLNTDDKRLSRLFFQPVLIYWALKSTND